MRTKTASRRVAAKDRGGSKSPPFLALASLSVVPERIHPRHSGMGSSGERRFPSGKQYSPDTDIRGGL